MLQVATERDPSMSAMPRRLTKVDHPRAIDAFIDYFGTGQRAADSWPSAMTAKEAV
jgi:hypothetical protein